MDKDATKAQATTPVPVPLVTSTVDESETGVLPPPKKDGKGKGGNGGKLSIVSQTDFSEALQKELTDRMTSFADKEETVPAFPTGPAVVVMDTAHEEWKPFLQAMEENGVLWSDLSIVVHVNNNNIHVMANFQAVEMLESTLGALEGFIQQGSRNQN
jgi:hypothetical protein